MLLICTVGQEGDMVTVHFKGESTLLRESGEKSRDVTLPTKVHLVKAMIFPVVMYGYESWTIKKAAHQRIESPLDCKEIKPVSLKRNQH